MTFLPLGFRLFLFQLQINKQFLKINLLPFITPKSSLFHTRPFYLQPHAASNRITRAEEAVLGASFNAQSQAPDIPGVLLHAASSRYATFLQAHLNPQSRTFIWCRCARIWKSSRLLSTPKIKPLMIHTSRIAVPPHVFAISHAKAVM